MKKINYEKLKAHLNSKWTNGCPMCNSHLWEPHKDLETYVPINLEADTVMYGSTNVFPVVLLKCTNCGFIAQISPVITEILEEI